MSIRAEKVASLIKRVLAKPVDDLAHEHNAGLVTITTVSMSDDLQIAKVYISIFGDKISPAKFLAILDDKKGGLRTVVGRNIRLRYTPDVRFYLDDTLEKMNHIQELIDNARIGSKEIILDMNDYNEKSFPKV